MMLSNWLTREGTHSSTIKVQKHQNLSEMQIDQRRSVLRPIIFVGVYFRLGWLSVVEEER